MARLHIIALYLFLGFPAWAQDAPQDTLHWARAAGYLDSLQDVSGYFLVGEKGTVMLGVGKGMADREKGIPYSEKTLGTIGSITKPFTATAILLLAERGLIDPADRMSLYLPDVPADKQAITIHHLLTHSAGFPGAIGDDYAPAPTDEFMAAAMQTPLLFAPGSGYAYSNVGYSLLGIILEKITGTTYSDFITENIFKPAGMITAGYRRSGVDYSLLTHGYTSDGADWGTSHDKPWDRDEPFWHLKANGGLLMSPQDMYRWYLALRNQTVLKPETLAMQLRPYVDEGGGTFYGYGYAVTPDGRRVEHNGGNRVFKADFRWFPKEDLFLYATSNDARVKLFRICDELLDVLKTGILPEPVVWMPIDDPHWHATGQAAAGRAMIRMLQSYTPESAEAFVHAHCTAELVERNGMQRLQEIFGMLSGDIGNSDPLAWSRSGDRIKIEVPGARADVKLSLLLTYAGDKIDRIGAELGSR